jgi:hypothetical protein
MLQSLMNYSVITLNVTKPKKSRRLRDGRVADENQDAEAGDQPTGKLM